MKLSKEHIDKTRTKLIEKAKAKKEAMLFFEKGGKIKDFKPKFSEQIVRPI